MPQVLKYLLHSQTCSECLPAVKVDPLEITCYKKTASEAGIYFPWFIQMLNLK